MSKPTDEIILAVITEVPHAPTYYVKNVLSDEYKGLKTAFVRRRLIVLEAAGKVQQTGTSSNSITWKLLEAA